MKNIITLILAAAAFGLPALAQSNPTKNTTTKTDLADLGGVCFWCREAVFERLPGVVSVTSGFEAGNPDTPH